MILLLLFSFLFAQLTFAQTDRPLCDLLDLPGCDIITKQLRRPSAVSLPSPAAAANTNPATVSLDKGFGLEGIHQSGNPVNFNITSGTGKTGAALISHSLENSFFGNRVPEIDDVYLDRREEYKQYRSNKVNLAVAHKLFRSRYLNMDIGIMGKRHPEIKRINPGAGIAGRLGLITFGASYYQDDVFLKLENYVHPKKGISYTSIYGTETYTERFKVQSYTVGTRIMNLSLDAGFIKSSYDFFEDETRIVIYSAGLFYRNFLVNLAIRKELSDHKKYLDGQLIFEREKKESYAGVQASITKFLNLGIQYNYFMLRELSFSATLYL